MVRKSAISILTRPILQSSPPIRNPPSFLLHPPPHNRPISTYGYEQAKSLVYSKHGDPKDVLSLHTHSLPPPHSTLLTLRALSSPLNPADINQIQGVYASLPPLTTALGTPLPSAVPGNEGVFQVLRTGSAVRTVAPGDWVIANRAGFGTWRTHVQVDEAAVMRVEREGLTREQVASVGVNPVTGWRLLRDFGGGEEGKGEGGGRKRRRWVVLNGANSGVGRAVLQLGRRWGWGSIAVVRARGSEEEGRRLREEMEGLGATRVVSEEEVMMGRGFKERVMEWTDGGREEVVLGLNCVGGKAAVAMAKVLSPGARFVTYGAMSKQPMVIPAGMMIFKDVRFEGFWVSKWGEEHPREKEETVREILDLMRRGEFQDVPTVEVPWEWDTKQEGLVDAVQGTLEGYRKGKGVFVFGDT